MPFGLVVKSGSKACASTSGAIPLPVSASESCTKSPVSGKPSSWRKVMFCAAIVKRPPVGIASRAFTDRLITASSSSAISTRIGQMPGGMSNTSADFDPSDVFSSSRHEEPSHCGTSIVSLRSGCLRATPSNWRVSDWPFFSARSMAVSSMSRCAAPRRRTIWILLEMIISRLLKSCATLPTRLPSASILRDCR